MGDCNIAEFTAELGLSCEEAAEMFDEFMEEVSAQVCELAELLKCRDRDAMRANLHNIKGLASGYRIDDLYGASLPLSQAVRDGNWEDAEEYLNKLVSIWSCAKARIEEYFKGREG